MDDVIKEKKCSTLKLQKLSEAIQLLIRKSFVATNPDKTLWLFGFAMIGEGQNLSQVFFITVWDRD